MSNYYHGPQYEKGMSDEEWRKAIFSEISPMRIEWLVYKMRMYAYDIQDYSEYAQEQCADLACAANLEGEQKYWDKTMKEIGSLEAGMTDVIDEIGVIKTLVDSRAKPWREELERKKQLEEKQLADKEIEVKEIPAKKKRTRKPRNAKKHEDSKEEK